MVDTRTSQDNIARYLNVLIVTIGKETLESNNQPRGCLSKPQHSSIIKNCQGIEGKKGVKQVKVTNKIER